MNPANFVLGYWKESNLLIVFESKNVQLIIAIYLLNYLKIQWDILQSFYFPFFFFIDNIFLLLRTSSCFWGYVWLYKRRICRIKLYTKPDQRKKRSENFFDKTFTRKFQMRNKLLFLFFKIYVKVFESAFHCIGLSLYWEYLHTKYEFNQSLIQLARYLIPSLALVIVRFTYWYINEELRFKT